MSVGRVPVFSKLTYRLTEFQRIRQTDWKSSRKNMVLEKRGLSELDASGHHRVDMRV